MAITQKNFDVENIKKRIEFEVDWVIRRDRMDKLNPMKAFNHAIGVMEETLPDKFAIKYVDLHNNGNGWPAFKIVYYGESKEEFKRLMKENFPSVYINGVMEDSEIEEMIDKEEDVDSESF